MLKTKKARAIAPLKPFTFAVALGVGFAHSAEDYSQWGDVRTYTVNTSTSGSGWSGTATNFPLLVRLGDDDSVFAQAKAGGADIRFAKPDGTPLPYEIEHWDATGKTAAIWVLIDEVKGDLADQPFRMYWGKADAADASSGSAVFSPSNGFVGVWHMNGTDEEADVTGNGNVAAGAGTEAIGSVTGHIGKGRSLARESSHHFVVEDAPSLNMTVPALTLSAWVNATDWVGSSRIFQKGEGGQAAQYGMRETSLNRMSIEVNSGNVNDASSAVPATGAWALMHAVVDASSQRLYFNGVEVLNSTYTGDDLVTTSSPLHLGRQPGGANYFNGSFDEMRVQNVARTADWAALEFANQKAGQTLVQVVAASTPDPDPDPETPVEENYAQWSGMRSYTVNTSSLGTTWTSTETNFPLLVRLGADDSVFAQAKADGSDLRFTKPDGTTRLPHEIEHWDATGKSAAVWVLIDEVKGNTLNQLFRMYWGKADAPDSSKGSSVFNPAHGFAGVWHMNGTGDETDATGNGNVAVATNAPGTATGVIGKGRSLARGTSQHFVVADAASLNMTAPGLTLSAWVNATDWEGSSRIFQKGEGGDASQYGLRETSLDRLAIDVNATNVNDAASAVPEAGTWALVHAIVDSTTRRLYINGEEVINAEYPGGDLATTTVPLHLGRQPGAANYFNGTLDEMRVQHIARSAEWVKLEYETQKAGQVVVHVEGQAPAVPQVPDNYTLWSGMRTYTINTTASGVNWTGTETNFPLLVRLGNDDSVFTQAKADGSDIRFTKTDGTTRIPHEIEHWDATAKSAAIWVLIDEVKGNTLNQLFRMYWGKADAPDSSKGSSVFNPAHGFAGVWHMNGTGDETDATGNGNVAVATNAPGTATGVIGKGRSLARGTSQHFVVADAASLNMTAPGLTLSAWVNATDWEGSSRIFQKGEGGDASQYGLRETSLDRLAIDVNATNVNDAASAVPEAGTWALVHAIVDSTTRRLYINGEEVINAEYPGGDLATTTVPLHLGRQPGAANYFNGTLDEMRVQHIARSAEWVKLEYETQKAGQVVVHVEGQAPAVPQVPDNYTLWSGMRTYTINTTASGVNWTGTETNFPLLVRLGNDDSVFTQAKADGSDIRFTKTDGTTRIPHEIEHWDATAKSAAIWVLIDEVKGNTLNQLFRMYWGKSDAADSSSSAAVFTPANGFVGVWHMSGTADETDATGNGNTAVAENAPGSVAGHIGKGRSLARESSHHFVVADAASLNWTTPAFTLSAWVKATDWEGSSRIFQKGEGGDAAQFGLRETSLDRLAIDINATNLNAETSAVPEADTWALVHAHLEGTVKRIYLNGQEVASGDFEGDLATTTVPLHLGHQPGGANYFNGVLDEMRVQKVARSAAWIMLEYESQKVDQKLVQVTPSEGIVGIADAASQRSAFATVAAGGAGAVVFRVTGASSATVAVSDMQGRVVWSGVFAPGAGSLTWDGRGASQGVYVARIHMRDLQGRASVATQRFMRIR